MCGRKIHALNVVAWWVDRLLRTRFCFLCLNTCFMLHVGRWQCFLSHFVLLSIVRFSPSYAYSSILCFANAIIPMISKYMSLCGTNDYVPGRISLQGRTFKVKSECDTPAYFGCAERSECQFATVAELQYRLSSLPENILGNSDSASLPIFPRSAHHSGLSSLVGTA
jgi:hypothetical protein